MSQEKNQEKTVNIYRIDEDSLKRLDSIELNTHIYDMVVPNVIRDCFGYKDYEFPIELDSIFIDAEYILHKIFGDDLVLSVLISFKQKFADFIVADIDDRTNRISVEVWRLNFFAK